ncbi:MAG: M20/M25/M40 family metallo-hydrolase, partial [Solirubrobacteraceae bacterium]
MALQDEAVYLLRRLLRLDTSNPPGNETPAAELLRSYLEAAGVPCELDAEGYVWGRGAVDMKNEVATRAVALAHLARSGWRGTGDLLFVAVADEEDGTEGAGMRWLAETRPDLATDYVINEGGAERLALADGRVVS